MPTDAARDATSSPSPTSGTSSDPARPDESFPKSRRLLKRPEFQRVYDSRQRVVGPYFALHFAPREDPGPGRAGLTVSRKVGKAVVRNRAKRLLRESIRRSWDVFPDGLDAVFHARRDIVDATFEQVQREVRFLLEKTARRLRGPLH